MTKTKLNELERAINERSFLSIILSCLSELIKPINFPSELERNFKYFLIQTLYKGKGFIVRGEDGTLHYTHGELVEPWDDFGFGLNYISFTAMGKEFRGELNKDGCVIFPYSSRRKINIFDEVADHLAEITSSEKFLLKWAKVAPFLLVKDSKTKNALQDTINSVMSGNMMPVLSDNTLSDLINDNNTESFTIKDVMQADRIRDLEYISMYKETLVKDIFSLFGVPVQSSMKKAQQSVDEVNNLNGSCYILPLDILSNFKQFAADLNNTFGLNVDFKLNDIIENEISKNYHKDAETAEDETIEIVEQTTTDNEGDAEDEKNED